MAKSPKDVLDEFQSNMPKLARGLSASRGGLYEKAHAGRAQRRRAEPQAQGTDRPGHRDPGPVRLLIVIHVKKCLEAGATKEEIAEVCGVAILMGGGLALTYSTFVAKAVEEFGKP